MLLIQIICINFATHLRLFFAHIYYFINYDNQRI